MPVASLSVSQDLLGEDYTQTLGGDWFARFTAALMLGAAVGGIVLGNVGDVFGRSRALGISVLSYSVFAGMGALVQTQEQMLILRFLVGLGVGGVWPNAVALAAECWPDKSRPIVAGLMGAALNGGILMLSQIVRIRHITPDSWRWVFYLAAVPAMLGAAVLVWLPESPLWLVTHGRAVAAAAVVRRWIGPDVSPPHAPPVVPAIAGRWSQLLSPRWRRRTIVGCTFFTCQVIPYFAVGTFVTRVLEALEVGDSFVGGLVGANYMYGGTIAGSFSCGSVSGSGGGLAGYNAGSISGSYWDKQTSGQAHSVGSADSFGLSTAQSRNQAAYAGWDFVDTWAIGEGVSYPALRPPAFSGLLIGPGANPPAPRMNPPSPCSFWGSAWPPTATG